MHSIVPSIILIGGGERDAFDRSIHNTDRFEQEYPCYISDTRLGKILTSNTDNIIKKTSETNPRTSQNLLTKPVTSLQVLKTSD